MGYDKCRMEEYYLMFYFRLTKQQQELLKEIFRNSEMDF